MKAILLFIEQNLVRPMEKVSSQRHLSAIRNGLLAVFPISLIGSAFYILANLPLPENWKLTAFITRHTDTILIPYRMTVVLVTLYMVVGVGSSLARYYRFNQISGALVALAAFLMTTIPMRPAGLVPDAFLQGAAQAGLDTSWYQSLQNLGWVLPQTPMSGVGVYVGAISAILGVETMRLSRRISRKIKKTGVWSKTHVPESLVITLDTLLPVFLVVVFLFVIRDIIGFDLQNLIFIFFDKIIRSSTSLSGAMIYVLVLTLFAFFGIIGYGVSGSAAGVAWASLLSANQAAHAAGTALPNVAPLPFFHYFVAIGGTGAVLSLVALMCFSKSGYLRKLGLSCLVPSVMNVNQPAIYGVPVILNPYMFIPFILGPQITTFITYLSMRFNLVGRPFSDPSKSMPFVAGAFLSTGDWKAILLCLLNFCISTVIYYPFFKLYERKLIEEGEQRAAKHALDEKNKLKITSVD